MSKIHFDYDRLVAEMDRKRRSEQISVRALGTAWDIRAATLVEWKTKRRQPALEHTLTIADWLGLDLGDLRGYLKRAE